MSTVTLYSFESEDGGEESFTTFDSDEAQEHARQYGLRCMANEYEYRDQSVAWDYTPSADPKEEDPPHDLSAEYMEHDGKHMQERGL